MRKIEVVAAVLVRDGRVFATQRGYGEFKDKWEFPGGKMEAGESREVALRREIREELDTEIAVGKLLCTVEYDYPAFHLTMHCYLCSVVQVAVGGRAGVSGLAASRHTGHSHHKKVSVIQLPWCYSWGVPMLRNG